MLPHLRSPLPKSSTSHLYPPAALMSKLQIPSCNEILEMSTYYQGSFHLHPYNQIPMALTTIMPTVKIVRFALFEDMSLKMSISVRQRNCAWIHWPGDYIGEVPWRNLRSYGVAYDDILLHSGQHLNLYGVEGEEFIAPISWHRANVNVTIPIGDIPIKVRIDCKLRRRKDPAGTISQHTETSPGRAKLFMRAIVDIGTGDNSDHQYNIHTAYYTATCTVSSTSMENQVKRQMERQVGRQLKRHLKRQVGRQMEKCDTFPNILDYARKFIFCILAD